MATIPKRCSDSFHERKTKDHASGSPLLMVCTLVLFLESCNSVDLSYMYVSDRPFSVLKNEEITTHISSERSTMSIVRVDNLRS
jgi:hypothetical protein